MQKLAHVVKLLLGEHYVHISYEFVTNNIAKDYLRVSNPNKYIMI